MRRPDEEMIQNAPLTNTFSRETTRRSPSVTAEVVRNRPNCEATASAVDCAEFMRLDLGDVLHQRNGATARQSMRLLVGNPVTMSSMVQHVPDAGSYAPVTILIDERPDGVHLSYDRMASFLATYGSPEALAVAQGLDSKVEALLVAAAG